MVRTCQSAFDEDASLRVLGLLRAAVIKSQFDLQLPGTLAPSSASLGAQCMDTLAETTTGCPGVAGVEPVDAEYVCPKCGVAFTRPDTLRRHMGGNCPQA